MECIFCKFENPSHANFCMNCGSPQNLRICVDCGAMNEKNAHQCISCKALLTKVKQAAVDTQNEAVEIDIVSEAEALAKEASKFKQFIVELQSNPEEVAKDIEEEQLLEIVEIEKLLQKNPEPNKDEPNLLADEGNAEQMQIEAQRSRQWGYFSFTILVILACSIGYYLNSKGPLF